MRPPTPATRQGHTRGDTGDSRGARHRHHVTGTEQREPTHSFLRTSSLNFFAKVVFDRRNQRCLGTRHTPLDQIRSDQIVGFIILPLETHSVQIINMRTCAARRARSALAARHPDGARRRAHIPRSDGRTHSLSDGRHQAGAGPESRVSPSSRCSSWSTAASQWKQRKLTQLPKRPDSAADPRLPQPAPAVEPSGGLALPEAP